MKILITENDGHFEEQGWYIKQNESGFWAYLSPRRNIPVKFPWNLYNYKSLEEK